MSNDFSAFQISYNLPESIQRIWNDQYIAKLGRVKNIQFNFFNT